MTHVRLSPNFRPSPPAQLGPLRAISRHLYTFVAVSGIHKLDSKVATQTYGTSITNSSRASWIVPGRHTLSFACRRFIVARSKAIGLSAQGRPGRSLWVIKLTSRAALRPGLATDSGTCQQFSVSQSCAIFNARRVSEPGHSFSKRHPPESMH
jgi:hypothetical protein